MELVKGISVSLGLEEGYIEKALNMELGLQLFISNLFPPCPQPELAMGLPPHSDHALLTLLINNGISGFQLQRQGKWVNVNSIPNAFMVIFGDQMEVRLKIMHYQFHFHFSFYFNMQFHLHQI